MLSKRRSLVFLALLAQPALAAPPPLPAFALAYLDTANLKYELPRAHFESYMREYFKSENQPEPWAINEDFNGDDVTDWAGLLRNTNGRLDLVVIYSDECDYSHQVLTSAAVDQGEISAGVVVEPPGQVSGFPFEDGAPVPTITMINHGIHLLYFEKASVLYYWDQGSFSEMVTSD
ncbi:MAG: hypothetical protein OER97_05800 [Gammaproteobacteria bacterium]|nr:hypothetical protein [Gammaproteobacteria bacterium]